MTKTTQNPQQFAQNHSQLAQILGISRQALHHWSKRQGAPKARQDGRHSVADWIHYLNQRTALLAKCAGTPHMGQAELQPEQGLTEASVMEEGRQAALCSIGGCLPGAVSFAGLAARIVLNDRQLDLMTHALFEVFSAVLKIEVDDDDVPGEIVAARKRLQDAAAASTSP